MNRGLKCISSVILAAVVLNAPIFRENIDQKEVLHEWEWLPVSISTSTTWELDEEWWQEELHKKEMALLKEKMEEEIKNIPYDFNSQKREWFITYKSVVEKYPKEFHKPTIYDAYNTKELNLLFRIVQAEAGDEYGFMEKANVASVIFNRHYSKGISLTSVLTAKKQFSVYTTGKYKHVEVDENTVLACEYVFMFGDTTNGCMAFRSDKCLNNWYSWKYQFSDKAHYFYR